jgi:hypothetical protein
VEFIALRFLEIYLRVRIIESKNLPEVRSLKCRGFSACLTKADAMSHAYPVQHHLVALLMHSEVIARNGVPTQVARKTQP